MEEGYELVQSAFDEYMRDTVRRERSVPLAGLASYRDGQAIPYEKIQKLKVLPPEPKKRTPSMKLRNAAIILDDTITSIKASFTTGKDTYSTQEYTFLCEKTLANTLDKNSLVVCQTSKGYAVCRVRSVDLETDIDMDDSYDYNWVIQSVDIERLTALDENLVARTAQMKSMQRNALRAQVRAQIEQGKLPDLNALRAKSEEE